MKNKLKKYAAIGTIAIMGLLLANTAVEKTVTLISDTDTSCVTVYSGGEKTVGHRDNEYKVAEKYETDAEIYEDIQSNSFSTPIIETMINDGHLLGYVDQLKAEGWIPQDFTPAGSFGHQVEVRRLRYLRQSRYPGADPGGIYLWGKG